MFQTVVGRSEYYLRVPFRGAPGAGHLTARKWLNARLAQRFGLPVRPLVPIRVSVRELTLLGAGGDLELNDAGIFLAVPSRVRRDGQLRVHVPAIRVALAWLWDSATKPLQVAARPEQEPAFFRARDDAEDPYELADLSGSSLLWENALRAATADQKPE